MKTIVRISAVLVCLFVVVASGCSTYKDDFEKAKGTISALESKILSLTDRMEALRKETGDLQDKSEKLIKEKADLTVQTSRLQEDNSALSENLAQLKKRSAEFEKTTSDLKKENKKLTQNNKDLQDQISTLTRASASTTEIVKPRETLLGTQKPQSESEAVRSPCDALVEYMRRSGAIVRGASGEERAKQLAALKSEYMDKMRGAPAKAISEAEAWVAETIRYIEKPDDDSVFRILTRRNGAFKACGKSPEEAGF
jgi:chromosome segregation ATPase